MTGLKRRIEKLERQRPPRRRLVVRDECGHELYPLGKPRPGDAPDVVQIGGICLERDI